MRRLSTKDKLIKELSSDSSFSRDKKLSIREINLIFMKSCKLDDIKYPVYHRNKEVPVETEFPIWYETRGGNNGPHLQLLCVDESFLSEEEQYVFDRIVDVWMSAQECIA